MGCVHQCGCLLIEQVRRESVGATEASDPYASCRKAWMADSAGEGGDDIDAISDQGRRQLPRLRGTAQDHDGHDRQPRSSTAMITALRETALARRLALAMSATCTARPLPRMPRSSMVPW